MPQAVASLHEKNKKGARVGDLGTRERKSGITKPDNINDAHCQELSLA